MKIIFVIIFVLLFAGCSPSRHHGRIYLHDPNHIEVVFDRPMTMDIEKDDIKVHASSQKPGLLEDIIKVLLLRPR